MGTKRPAPYRMCNRNLWVGVQPTDPESDPIPVKTLAEDPASGLVGYVAIAAANTWTPIILYDSTGTAFVPTAAAPAGLKDVIIKNLETVTGQFQMRMLNVALPPLILDVHLTAGATVMMSFNGCPPVWAALEVLSSVGAAHVTIVGVQN